jgi:hypothetical protein
MNLPLHFGLLGALEAGLIALAVGMLFYWAWHHLCLRLGWSNGRAIGWACVTAVVASAGIDTWNLFYLGTVRLESPVYARMALASIHDPDGLGTRMVLEIAGTLTGVVLGWLLFGGKLAAGHGQAPSSGDGEKRE